MRSVDRRAFLTAASATLALPASARQTMPPAVGVEAPATATRRNAASFAARDWREHFGHLRGGAILVGIDTRALHLWTEDGGHRLYPSSVPLSADLARRGRTRVVRKLAGPTWTATPNMIRRNPDLPRFIPSGPENPLGTHALYPSWTSYRIHGTHDPRKVGRMSSNGCIGPYDEHIAEVFGLTGVGTQVLLI